MPQDNPTKQLQHYASLLRLMDITSPSPIASSFDPALHLHSEVNEIEGPVTLPSCSNSDDLDALHLQHQETVALKNKLGVVIQHRAWKIADVFRSEEDRFYGVSSMPTLHGSRDSSHGLTTPMIRDPDEEA